jgi:hypothetical protein
MNRHVFLFCFLAASLAASLGCSSKPPTQSRRPLDRIQGKAQVLEEGGGASDTSLNAGGSSVYLWQGVRRYRLFLRTPVEIVHGNEYVAEGVDAQKVIDEIGDPDQGKNGYPLQASCERAVTMAWTNVSFDAIESTASLVRERVKRYPARSLFLVTRIQPVTADAAASAEAKKEAGESNITEVSVAADKQSALLIEGPTAQIAPLWLPAGGTVSCKVVINSQGKVSELETGAQLCEAVPWSQFRYQPPVRGGRPVKVSTEVEVRFEPRK